VPADQPTIQAGLDAAAEGDTVLVAPGTYTGPGNYNLDFSASLDTVGVAKDLVLVSEAGPEATIIDVAGDGTDLRRGFLFKSRETRASVLEGFTIENGWMTAGGGGGTVGRAGVHELSAGGIAVRLHAAPTIRNCVIRDCRAFYSGGAVESSFFANPLFEDCTFQGNFTQDRGGAIATDFQGEIVLRRCLITGNQADVAGGGIAFSAFITLENCVVVGNQSTVGGGIDVRFGASSSAIAHTILWGNCADDGENLYSEDAVGPGALTISCSKIDVEKVSAGHTTFVDCSSGDPLLCDPPSCEDAPTSAGTFTLAENSSCLPDQSVCGGLIGVYGVGCGPLVPVAPSTWSAIKSRFRPTSTSPRP
jgi:hypothetical protein